MSFQMVSLKRPAKGSDASKFGYQNAKKVQAFHSSFPEYKHTPLAKLDNLAKQLGLGNIYVKDESYRFGLNAFKVLGGSFAIGSYIAKRLGMDIKDLPYNVMTSPALKQKLGEITFVTATDGNHGRGVAWTANRLQQKSIVYMPKGSSPERLKNIQALGSDASITDLCYDDAVQLANTDAKKLGGALIQDTDWEGYTEVPAWIMQGYTTMALEAVQQLKDIKPTHVFLQAGVGAMSGAVCGFFADLYGDKEGPIVTIVEPEGANCIFRTAKANDGKLHPVTENMHTIMAGLCCGVPCTTGWNILRDHADHFVSEPDFAAATGMRVLGNPLPGDDKVISGESGAATMGFVVEVMQRPELAEMRKALKLDKNSKVLCFSTEGDTDKENYRRIVWNGAWPDK